MADIVTEGRTVLAGAGQQLTTMLLEQLRNYADLNRVKQPVFVQDPIPTRLA